MKRNYFEIFIGFLVIIFSICFVIFTMKITNKKIKQNYYKVYAMFDNVEGVNIGTKIKIGGIEIGEIDDLTIKENYRVKILLKINKKYKIPVDSNIKISTSGIIGGKYLKIDVGGDNKYMKNGDYFEFTESVMDLEDMITRFMLNKASEGNKNDKK